LLGAFQQEQVDGSSAKNSIKVLIDTTKAAAEAIVNNIGEKTLSYQTGGMQVTGKAEIVPIESEKAKLGAQVANVGSKKQVSDPTTTPTVDTKKSGGGPCTSEDGGCCVIA
jgi:hypothetical protein